MVDQASLSKKTKNSGNKQLFNMSHGHWISWISQQHEEDCGMCMGALQLKSCLSSDVQNNQL